MMKTTSKINDTVVEALRAFGVVLATKKAWGVELEIQYHELTFDDLTKISEFFGTKKINIGSETRETGYCDSCHGTEARTILSILEPTRGMV